MVKIKIWWYISFFPVTDSLQIANLFGNLLEHSLFDKVMYFMQNIYHLSVIIMHDLVLHSLICLSKQ